VGEMGDTPNPPPKGFYPLWNPHFHTSWFPVQPGMADSFENVILNPPRADEESLPTGARDPPAVGDTNRVIFVLRDAHVNGRENFP